MRTIKGFSAINALADNAAGVVAPFGELSTYALTFSKEKSYYSNTATHPDVEFVGFSVKDEIPAHIVLNNTVRDHVLLACQWVYNEYDQFGPGNIPIQSVPNKATFIAALTAALDADLTMDTSTVDNVDCGLLVAGPDAGHNMPQYITWEVQHGGIPYTIKIWFTDTAFRAQYDEYEIRIINPLVEDGDLDDLHVDIATLTLALNGITPADMINKVQSVVGTTPATIVKTHDMLWHDPNAPLNTLTITWTVVIWGAAGDSIDNINDAIEAYISDNSAVLLSEWQIMLEDLYNSTEFAFIPLWQNISSPETMLDYGIYSPTVRPNQMKQRALDHSPPNYGGSFNMSTHLDNNLQLTQTPWRSMPVLVVSYPGNPGSIFKFSQIYGDYMSIPSTDGDFARMDLNTQAFSTELVTMLEHALTLVPADPAPVGYQKVTRTGKLYVAKEIQGRMILVLTKHSYLNP